MKFNLAALSVLAASVGNALIDFSETLELETQDPAPAKSTRTTKSKPAAEEPAAEEPAEEKTPAKSTRGKSKPAPEPEPEPEGEEPVTLEDLQELAATLLENGKRKVLNGILKDAGITALSAAEPDQFDDLYDALYDEVEALAE